MDVRMAAALAGAVPDVSAFCAEQGISRQSFYKWRRRFAEAGIEGLGERSRRPNRVPGRSPTEVEDQVVRLRKELGDQGADNGPDPIRWALLAQPDPPPVVPSRATIARILTRRGLVTPAPKKRPHSSRNRFTFPRPNDCWQSDWTSWTLADASPVAIAGTLDDHSRYLGGLLAGPGDGDAPLVWATMTAAIGECGLPARSLTDNGLVYTGRFIHATVAFETNLAALGVQTINSGPSTPRPAERSNDTGRPSNGGCAPTTPPARWPSSTPSSGPTATSTTTTAHTARTAAQHPARSSPRPSRLDPPRTPCQCR
jgi:hypothetical protein